MKDVAFTSTSPSDGSVSIIHSTISSPSGSDTSKTSVVLWLSKTEIETAREKSKTWSTEQD